MKYWLKNGPGLLIRENKYKFGDLTSGLYKAGLFLYEESLQKYKKPLDYITNKFRTLCFDTNGKPYYCEKITNAIEFAQAVSSTGNIPFIGSFNPSEFRNQKLWDGCLNNYFGRSYLYECINAKKTLIISLINVSSLMLVNSFK